MVDGAGSLISIFYGMNASKRWDASQRAANILDGGAPYYDTYETADRKFISLGPIEAKFFAELVQRLGLDAKFIKGQNDRSLWPEMRAAIAAEVRSKTRDQWTALLEGTDVCFGPVLTMDEAPHHPHAVARGAFIEVDGVVQPAPAPRFSRSQPVPPRAPVHAGAHTDEVLAQAGFSAAEIAQLRASGAAAGGASE